MAELTPDEIAALKALAALAPQIAQALSPAPVVEAGSDAPETHEVPPDMVMWDDDGHRFFRRRIANPAIIERINQRIELGHLVHVSTQDDVEVYRIVYEPSDPKELDVQALETACIQAACARQWEHYRQCVSEFATRFKAYTAEFGGAGQRIFSDKMAYIEYRISRRGGPSQFEIQAAMRALREEKTGTLLYLPPGGSA